MFLQIDQRTYAVIAINIAIFSCMLSITASAADQQSSSIAFFGDARLRAESDWNSSRSDGSERESRSRLRGRVRAGITWQASQTTTATIRLRSGSRRSHQSPHITLADSTNSSLGDTDVVLDQWFIKYERDRSSYEIGRQELTFYKQNEIFWDSDVTPVGVSGTWSFSPVEISVGFYSLPVGMHAWSGTLATSQLVYERLLREGSQFTFSIGFLNVNSDAADSEADLLLDGNGRRDFRTWVASARYESLAGRLPYSLGVDLIRNSSDYDAAMDAFSAMHADEKDGVALTISAGRRTQASWMLQYTYAHIGTLAMNNAYSQDDWLRWGSASQTRSSNFHGHEIRLRYGIAEHIDVQLRRFSVVGNVLREVDSVALETGDRLRLDFNIRF